MRGYTTVEINGQTVGMRFGLYAFQLIGKAIEELKKREDLPPEMINLRIAKDRMFAAYLCDCEDRNINPVLTIADFSYFIEDCSRSGNVDQLVKVRLAYEESITIYTEKEEPTEEIVVSEKKNKKSTGRKLNSSALENA